MSKVSQYIRFALLEEGYHYDHTVHDRGHFEILIFRYGEGHLNVDTNRFEIKRNLFIFLSPGQKRKWSHHTKNIQGYTIQFERGFLEDFFADSLFTFRLQFFYNDFKLPIFMAENQRLFSFKHDIFEEMKNELLHDQNDSTHLLRSILYYVLIKLNRFYCAYHGLEATTQGNTVAFQFKRAIEQHLKTKKKVQDYADLLGISRVSLNKVCKQKFNQSAIDLINNRLIREIKNELIYSNDTISQIAYGLNFSEPNNLIRFFKKNVGVTPKAFRIQHLSK